MLDQPTNRSANRLKLTLSAFALAAPFATPWAAPTFAAAPFMSINFDADTVGSAPTTSHAATPPLTVPYSIGGYAASTTDPFGDSPPTADSGTIKVQNSGSLSKAAVFETNPTNNENGALYMDTQFQVSGQQFSMGFDLNVVAAPTNATVQPKTLNGAGTVGIAFGINDFITADSHSASPVAANGFRFAAAPTSENGGVFAIRSPNGADLQSFFDYTEGTTYHIDLVADYDTGKVATYVNSAFKGSFSFAASGFADVTSSELFMFLNGQTDETNSIAIDNIVSTVPEPVSLSMAAVSGFALLRRRR